jgi:hypothetical protein
MDIMGKVLFTIFGVVMLGLCFIVGMLPAGAVEGGSSSVLTWGIFAGLIMAALCAWLGYMFGDMELNKPRATAIVSAIIAFAVTMWLPVDTYVNGHSYAVYARQVAPVVRTFVLEHFDDIDGDGDGTITDSEMDTALSRLSLTNEQRQALEFMRSNQSEAGHVIGSYTTTTYVWISTGNGGGYMSPVITTTYIYGVSRGDLEHYPERVIEKWKLW